MTPEQLNNFKQAIITAIDKHLVGGGTLAIGHFGSGNARCPITCLLDADDVGYSSLRTSERLTTKFGFLISDKEMWSFIGGFDNVNNNIIGSPPNKNMMQLGTELRQKYLPNKD